MITWHSPTSTETLLWADLQIRQIGGHVPLVAPGVEDRSVADIAADIEVPATVHHGAAPLCSHVHLILAFNVFGA